MTSASRCITVNSQVGAPLCVALDDVNITPFCHNMGHIIQPIFYCEAYIGCTPVTATSYGIGQKYAGLSVYNKQFLALWALRDVNRTVGRAPVSYQLSHLLILLPIAAGIMLWGHYWDAENVMTIPSMVAPSQYRGTASGFANIFVKIPAFFSIFLFPQLFDAIGKGGATLFIAIFPLIGLLSAIYVLPETFQFKGDVLSSN